MYFSSNKTGTKIETNAINAVQQENIGSRSIGPGGELAPEVDWPRRWIGPGWISPGWISPGWIGPGFG